MVSEFKWPESIPSGQRTYRTPSCIIRKTIKSIELEYPDGKCIDLFNDKEFDETWRLIFITGAIGIFCGIKNNLYAGYVEAAYNNCFGNDPDNPYYFSARYPDCKLKITWNSDNKSPIVCLPDKLTSILIDLHWTLELSRDSFSLN